VFEQAQVRHNGLTDCSFADMDFKSEVLKGFYSIFIFKCRVCGIENNNYSEKIKQECSMPINKAVVSGCFAIGTSFSIYHLPISINICHIFVINIISMQIWYRNWPNAAF